MSRLRLPLVLTIVVLFSLCGFASAGEQNRSPFTDSPFMGLYPPVKTLPLAQAWENRNDQNPLNNVGNIRAKSLIKLALFIVTIIGGIIAFVIKFATGRERTATNASAGAGSPSGSVARPMAPSTPEPYGAYPPATTKPARRSRSQGGLLLLGVFLFGGCLLFGLVASVTVGLVALSWRPTSTAEQANAARNAMRNYADIEASRALHEASEAEFDARWQAANDAVEAAMKKSLTLSSPATAEPTEQFDPLDSPGVALPEVHWNSADLVASGLAIRNQGMSFEDISPAGGVLVGLRVSADKIRIRSIQPIYQLADQYFLGEVFGQLANESQLQWLAKPGDAIAAVRIDLSGRVDGMQAEFAALKNGRLDLSTRYPSEFVGRPVANNRYVIESEGDVFVGVAGKVRDGLDGFSLIRHMGLGKCPESLARFGSQNPRPLPRAGGQAQYRFEDDAPLGGLLVGMRVFTGRSWGGAIRALQPIYQIGEEYQVGRRYGMDGGIVKQALAKPGYAVGGVHAYAGLVLNSVTFHFHRTDGSRLDPNDSYRSEQFGSPGGGGVKMDTQGLGIVGVRGSFHDEMTSLEVIVAD